VIDDVLLDVVLVISGFWAYLGICAAGGARAGFTLDGAVSGCDEFTSDPPFCISSRAIERRRPILCFDLEGKPAETPLPAAALRRAEHLAAELPNF
jgi:hypothetical protein